MEPDAEEEIEEPSIFVVKTSIGYEKNVADYVYNKAKGEDVVYSVMFTPRLKGYLFVEAMDELKLKNAIKNIPHVRGLVKGSTDLPDIEHLLTPKPAIEGMAEGDIVEIVTGPFKGEKARVRHIEEAKEEITVELFESMVPIPITIKADSVRILERK